MDKRIDYDEIERSFGCDNCEHDIDGLGVCEHCCPGDYRHSPPSKYSPMRGTIQEKVWYNKYDEITYEEYLKFEHRFDEQ